MADLYFETLKWWGATPRQYWPVSILRTGEAIILSTIPAAAPGMLVKRESGE